MGARTGCMCMVLNWTGESSQRAQHFLLVTQQLGCRKEQKKNALDVIPNCDTHPNPAKTTHGNRKKKITTEIEKIEK